MKAKVKLLTGQANEVAEQHLRVTQTLKSQKEELFEEKKEEFRKTLQVEQRVEEVEFVDKQNWRRNESSSESESESEANNSLAIEFNLPMR